MSRSPESKPISEEDDKRNPRSSSGVRLTSDSPIIPFPRWSDFDNSIGIRHNPTNGDKTGSTPVTPGSADLLAFGQQKYKASTLSDAGFRHQRPPHLASLRSAGFWKNAEKMLGSPVPVQAPAAITAEQTSTPLVETDDSQAAPALQTIVPFDVIRKDEKRRNKHEMFDFKFDYQRIVYMEAHIDADVRDINRTSFDTQASNEANKVEISIPSKISLEVMPTSEDWRPAFAALLLSHGQLKERWRTMTSEYAQKLGRMTDDLRCCNKENAHLRTKNRRLESDLNNIENRLLDQEDIEREQKALKRENTELKRRFHAIRRPSSLTSEQLEKLIAGAKVPALETEIAKITSRNNDLCKELGEVTKRLHESEKDCFRLEELVQTLDMASIFATDQQQQRIIDLEKQRDPQLQRQNVKLQDKLTKASHQRDVLRRFLPYVRYIYEQAIDEQKAIKQDFEDHLLKLQKLGVYGEDVASFYSSENSPISRADSGTGENNAQRSLQVLNSGLPAGLAFSLPEEHKSEISEDKSIGRQREGGRNVKLISEARKNRPDPIRIERRSNHLQARRGSYDTRPWPTKLQNRRELQKRSRSPKRKGSLLRRIRFQDELYWDERFTKWPIQFTEMAEVLCHFSNRNALGEPSEFQKGEYVRVAMSGRDWWPVVRENEEESAFCLVPQSCLALVCPHLQKYNGYFYVIKDFHSDIEGFLSVTAGDIIEVAHANILNDDEGDGNGKEGAMVSWCARRTDYTEKGKPLPQVMTKLEEGFVAEDRLELLQNLQLVKRDLPSAKFCMCDDGRPYTAIAKVLETYQPVDPDFNFILEKETNAPPHPTDNHVDVAHPDRTGMFMCVKDKKTGAQGFMLRSDLKIQKKPFLNWDEEQFLPLTPFLVHDTAPGWSPGWFKKDDELVQHPRARRQLKVDFSEDAKKAYELLMTDINPTHKPWPSDDVYLGKKKKWDPWTKGVPGEGPWYLERHHFSNLPKPFQDSLVPNPLGPGPRRKRPRAKSLPDWMRDMQEIRQADCPNGPYTDVIPEYDECQSEPDVRQALRLGRKYIYVKRGRKTECLTLTEYAKLADGQFEHLFPERNRCSVHWVRRRGKKPGSPSQFAETAFPWRADELHLAKRWPVTHKQQFLQQLADDYRHILYGDYAFRSFREWCYLKGKARHYFPVRYLPPEFWDKYSHEHVLVLNNFAEERTEARLAYANHYVRALENPDSNGYVWVQRPVDSKVFQIPDSFLNVGPVQCIQKFLFTGIDIHFEVLSSASTSEPDDTIIFPKDYVKLEAFENSMSWHPRAKGYVTVTWDNKTESFPKEQRHDIISLADLDYTYPKLMTAKYAGDSDQFQPREVLLISRIFEGNAEYFDGKHQPGVLPLDSVIILPPSEWVDYIGYTEAIPSEHSSICRLTMRSYADNSRTPESSDKVAGTSMKHVLSVHGNEPVIDEWDWMLRIAYDHLLPEPEPSLEQNKFVLRRHQVNAESNEVLPCLYDNYYELSAPMECLDLEEPCLKVFELDYAGATAQSSEYLAIILISQDELTQRNFYRLSDGRKGWYAAGESFFQTQKPLAIPVRLLIEKGWIDVQWPAVVEAMIRLRYRPEYDMLNDTEPIESQIGQQDIGSNSSASVSSSETSTVIERSRSASPALEEHDSHDLAETFGEEQTNTDLVKTDVQTKNSVGTTDIQLKAQQQSGESIQQIEVPDHIVTDAVDNRESEGPIVPPISTAYFSLDQHSDLQDLELQIPHNLAQNNASNVQSNGENALSNLSLPRPLSFSETVKNEERRLDRNLRSAELTALYKRCNGIGLPKPLPLRANANTQTEECQSGERLSSSQPVSSLASRHPRMALLSEYLKCSPTPMPASPGTTESVLSLIQKRKSQQLASTGSTDLPSSVSITDMTLKEQIKMTSQMTVDLITKDFGEEVGSFLVLSSEAMDHKNREHRKSNELDIIEDLGLSESSRSPGMSRDSQRASTMSSASSYLDSGLEVLAVTKAVTMFEIRSQEDPETNPSVDLSTVEMFQGKSRSLEDTSPEVHSQENNQAAYDRTTVQQDSMCVKSSLGTLPSSSSQGNLRRLYASLKHVKTRSLKGCYWLVMFLLFVALLQARGRWLGANVLENDFGHQPYLVGIRSEVMAAREESWCSAVMVWLRWELEKRISGDVRSIVG